MKKYKAILGRNLYVTLSEENFNKNEEITIIDKITKERQDMKFIFMDNKQGIDFIILFPKRSFIEVAEEQK